MYIKNPSGGKVSWSSSNPKVATVSSKGKVKSVSAGTTIITAKLKYKGKTYKSKCKLTVKKICSLEELISYIYDN
jgi:glycerophosphoryl diester phosphodiesterase